MPIGAKKKKAQSTILHDEHMGQGNCKKVLSGLLVMPTSHITDNAANGGVKVGKGNVVRIRVTAATFIRFGTSTSMDAVDGTEADSLELSAAGVYLVVASDEYLRCSANPARIEVCTG